ncbi:MAG: hypothetical protein QXM38_04685 [Candidatus Aenigmatarchaeota archaeon]
MSKSIYEVASRRIDDMFDSWDKGIHQDSIEIIEEALEQAQKQEKLLELYKQLNIIYEKLYTMDLPEEIDYYYQMEIIKLIEQIKELEEEE